MKTGKFISLEGGEGAGKTTQAKRLAALLETKGIETLITREPGGTFGSEAIRELVLDGLNDRWSGMSELLLMYAARVDHVEKLIKPALERGVWVLCDRFADSTIAYQGFGRGIPLEKIKKIHEAALDGFAPDMTFLFDIDSILALKRVKTRGEKLTRFDGSALDFHKMIRKAFLEIAKQEPERVKVVYAEQTRDKAFEQITSYIYEKYPYLK